MAREGGIALKFREFFSGKGQISEDEGMRESLFWSQALLIIFCQHFGEEAFRPLRNIQCFVIDFAFFNHFLNFFIELTKKG